MPDVVRPEGLPFKEAIAYFQDKVKLPTKKWNDLWQGQHTRAFTVAGATKTDLLTDFYNAVEKGLTDGITKQDFEKDFDRIVSQYGWSYKGGRSWRTGVIFNTNMRTAYMSGRYKQMTDPDVLKARPYWMYDAVNDNRTRPEHKAWDGLILPADDPWWNTHYPPNGWGCRCSVRSVSESDLSRMGKSVDKAPDDGTYEWTDPSSGEIHEVPNGIDPGWAYNVGEASWGRPVAKRLLDEQAGGQWTDFDQRGPSSFRRAEQVPVLETPATLGQRARTIPQLRQSLRDAIGGDAATYTDPAGEMIQINQAVVDHILERPEKRWDGREAYFPLIPDLVKNPYEIWINFAKNELTGKVAVRKKYIKAVQVDKKHVIGLVGESVNGFWTGFNFFRGGVTGANNLRKGRLLWGKE